MLCHTLSLTEVHSASSTQEASEDIKHINQRTERIPHKKRPSGQKTGRNKERAPQKDSEADEEKSKGLGQEPTETEAVKAHQG